MAGWSPHPFLRVRACLSMSVAVESSSGQACVDRGHFGQQESCNSNSTGQPRCAAMVWMAILLVLAAYGLLSAVWAVFHVLKLLRDDQLKVRVPSTETVASSVSTSGDLVDRGPAASATMQSAASLAMASATVLQQDNVIWVTQRLTWHTTESCIHLKSACKLARVSATVDVMEILTMGGGASCKTCRVHGAVAVQ